VFPRHGKGSLAELHEVVQELRLDELEERRLIMPLLLRRIMELEVEIDRLNLELESRPGKITPG